MQMVFRFYGKVFSEADLIKKLKTRKDVGTHHQAMIGLAQKEGFYVYVNNDSSLKEIMFFLDKKIPVIVHYLEPDGDEGHYAIVVGLDKNNIILNDPWHGERFKIKRGDFKKRWHSEDGNFNNWIMVVSKEDRHLGKQYLPKN